MIWNITLSNAISDEVRIDGLPWPVVVRRHARSRSIRLRVDEGRSRFLLTHPFRVSRRAAVDWAAKQQEWAQRQVERVADAVPFEAGRTIAIEGTDRLLVWDPAASRTPTLSPDELRCGGPECSFASRVERFLRARARDVISAEVARTATAAGVVVRSVSVSDPRSRWGSCSSTGALRFSWRLILAPDFVRISTVAHEVAHRVHMHHGPQFHAFAAELSGVDDRAAHAWFRRHGAGLHWIGAVCAIGLFGLWCARLRNDPDLPAELV